MGDPVERDDQGQNDENQTSPRGGAARVSSPVGGTSGIDINYITNRVKAVLADPKGVWAEIKEEALSPRDVYMKYVLILAAIPPLASYLGLVIFGVEIPFTGGTYRVPIFGGLISAIIQYAGSLVTLGIVAFVIQKLGPSFKAAPSFDDALRLVAFSATASYVGGILSIVPLLGLLGILFGLYSLYTFYVGFGPMTRVPDEKRLMYFGATIVTSIIAMLIFSVVLNALSPVSLAPDMSAQATRSIDGNTAPIEFGGISIDPKKLEESMKNLEAVLPKQNN